MTETLDTRADMLLGLLDLERVEENLYLGQNQDMNSGRLFGGQVLAQATAAASRTVEGPYMHSMHGYFLTAGSPQTPVLYEVERVRDGRSFTTRRVVAIQRGKAIFNMDVSFQHEEPGYAHSQAMPNVPHPDELPDDVETARGLAGDIRLGYFARNVGPFELRSVMPLGSEGWSKERMFNPTWVRFPQQIDDPVLARCLLAYASDMGVVSTASLPHQTQTPRDRLQLASLDHALWVHRPFAFDDWLLFNKRTTSAGGSRGLIHAEVFHRNGDLVASVTQEGLLRIKV